MNENPSKPEYFGRCFEKLRRATEGRFRTKLISSATCAECRFLLSEGTDAHQILFMYNICRYTTFITIVDM